VHDTIVDAPTGASWLSRLVGTAAAATADRGTTIAIVLAVVSTAIGLALLYGWRPHAFLAMQVGLLGLYWVFAQGLGGIFTGQATDVGTAPPMILIAVMLTRRSARAPVRVPHRLAPSWTSRRA
jgi:hypothetical protein